MELEILGGEGSGVVIHGNALEPVVVADFPAFVGGLDVADVSRGDRVDGSFDDFLGFDRCPDGGLAEFGNVEAVGGGSAEGCAAENGGAVGEGEFLLGVGDAGDGGFDGLAEFPRLGMDVAVVEVAVAVGEDLEFLFGALS